MKRNPVTASGRKPKERVMTNEERKSDILFFMRRLAVILAVIISVLFFGHRALAQGIETPTVPVWMNQGLLCENSELAKQAIDELNTSLPFPTGCEKIVSGYEVLTTIKFIGYYEANGFVYDMVEFTLSGYRFKTPDGWDFVHFHEGGKMTFLTRYGYWNKVPVEDDVPETTPEPAIYIEWRDA